MELKTYTRARAATAAARKALAGHADFIVAIEPTVQGDRFGAIAALTADAGQDIVEAVHEAGFGVLVAPAEEHPTETVTETPVEDVLAEADADVEAAIAALEEEATPAPAKPKSGYIRGTSTVDTPCAIVWEIASGMLEANPKVTRKEIMDACMQTGVTYGTARTQYDRWRKARKNAE